MQQDESVAAFAIAEQWRVISPLTTTSSSSFSSSSFSSSPAAPIPSSSAPSSNLTSPSSMTAAFLGSFSSPPSTTLSTPPLAGQPVVSGQASLYLARDATGNQVVLKKTVARSRERAEEAQREVFILRKCNHVNVVAFCGAWNKPLADGGLEVNLVIELCYGGNLLDYQRSRETSGRRLTELEIVRILVQAARAVEHLHKFDPPVAHRDVKLENFLLSARDNAKLIKLCDLGSATMERMVVKTKEQRAALESQVERLTTPFYRAPELCDLYSRKEISEQVDIWSLGCLLYVLAYNAHAFSEKLAILNCSYTIPSDVYYSQEFKSLLSWMLDPDPTTRPRIGDVVDEVDLLLGNKVRVGAVARGTGRGERSSTALLARAAKAASTASRRDDNRETKSGNGDGDYYSSSSSTHSNGNNNKKNRQSSSSSSAAAAASPGGEGTTTKMLRGSAFVRGGGGDLASPSTGASASRSAALDARRAARSNPNPTPAASSAMKTPFDDIVATITPNHRNNPFDDMDDVPTPSFDPTFFSNPGMQSSSLAGFKEQLEPRPYVSMMSIKANDLHPGQVHTPSVAEATSSSATSTSSSSRNAGPPQISQYPMFFSDPPKHYVAKRG